MISEEMLQLWEKAMQSSDTNDWDDVIGALINEVRQLKKEADWLAELGSEHGCPTKDTAKICQVSKCTGVVRTKCWREAARKSVGA